MISGTDSQHSYDGTTSAAAGPTYIGLQTGDTLSGLTEAYENAATGTGKTLKVTGYTLNDGNNGHNYNVVTVDNLAGIINQAGEAPLDTDRVSGAVSTANAANSNLRHNASLPVITGMGTVTPDILFAPPVPFTIREQGIAAPANIFTPAGGAKTNNEGNE